jgi:uncharacterized membrane protein YgdD (TMEM256/DUF423 family)
MKLKGLLMPISKYNAIVCRTMMVFIGISGCFSVLFGAWLAHGGASMSIEVQARLSTALQYQFFHTLALLAAVIFFVIKPNRWLLFSACFFCIGILFFSVSLYFKTLFELTFIGKLTPLGGVSFALGWLCIGWAGKHIVASK